MPNDFQLSKLPAGRHLGDFFGRIVLKSAGEEVFMPDLGLLQYILRQGPSCVTLISEHPVFFPRSTVQRESRRSRK